MRKFKVDYSNGEVDFNALSDVVVDDVDMEDYPDFSDAFIVSGKYYDEELSEEECDILTDEYIDIYIQLFVESGMGNE